MIYHFYLDFSFLRLGKAFPVFFLKSYERLFLNRLPPDRPIIRQKLRPDLRTHVLPFVKVALMNCDVRIEHCDANQSIGIGIGYSDGMN